MRIKTFASENPNELLFASSYFWQNICLRFLNFGKKTSKLPHRHIYCLIQSIWLDLLGKTFFFANLTIASHRIAWIKSLKWKSLLNVQTLHRNVNNDLKENLNAMFESMANRRTTQIKRKRTHRHTEVFSIRKCRRSYYHIQFANFVAKAKMMQSISFNQKAI